MSYIESLEQKGITVPESYKTFRNSDDFESYNGMICSELDHEVYSETSELHFDWDDHMLDELLDTENPDLVPLAIIHSTDLVDDAYLAFQANSENCAVCLCQLDEETDDIELIDISDSLESFLEALSDPEDNYINYLEKKFSITLPQRYRTFMLSYEYVDYNGELKYNDKGVFFDEFPNLQWAAENYNQSSLQWIPLASVGEDHNEYGDALVIKAGEEDCPVYILNGEEQEQISSSLSEFLT
ncbi:hypothetical protein MNBD_GAMMA12-383 [hydrothermal vent metagenome]|uniref:Knr4/Smi1-like domain-containing protein n=1 Tax=hydrothermal vent metagenome TaxID=652676 RepID=A0A3B0YI29_9ZZZZ